MKSNNLMSWHKAHKQQALQGRYICLKNIKPLLKALPAPFEVSSLGESVQRQKIYQVKVGTGPLHVLAWSQMHGNESTTTKALFDLFKWFCLNLDTKQVQQLLNEITLVCIPMLNPDGAEAYTRLNANGIDLNRDAQERTQPESKVLHKCYTAFRPDLALNLHGQRSIFGVGEPPKSAIVSFLSPAQDALRTVTQSRKTGMWIISRLNKLLEEFIPGHIGRYDDGFNINCVGDTLQHLHIPTILFEAGHYPDDYEREQTRAYMFLSLIGALEGLILSKPKKKFSSNSYFSIPENKKCFYDWIIRAVHIPGQGVLDVALQYEETLRGGKIDFVPKIAQIADLENYKGHRELDLKGAIPDFDTSFEWKEGTTLQHISLKNKSSTTFSVKSKDLL